VPRLFLVIECKDGGGSGCNGWVAQASSPSEALDYFRKEILKSTSGASARSVVDRNWTEYLKLESNIDRPCYMQEYKIGSKSYYVEVLTLPDSRVAWIPTSFS
jgi:hypothetical protein